jgi:hypothetical protein
MGRSGSDSSELCMEEIFEGLRGIHTDLPWLYLPTGTSNHGVMRDKDIDLGRTDTHPEIG